MERKVLVHTPDRPVRAIVGPKDTIKSFLGHLDLADPNLTLSPLPYAQIIYDDDTCVYDLLQWNHLFHRADLPSVESSDMGRIDKKHLESFRNSQVGLNLANNSTKHNSTPLHFESDAESEAGDEGLDLFAILRMPSADNLLNANDAIPRKSPLAQLWVVPKRTHLQPPQAFNSNEPYHFIKTCNQKVKGFIQHTMDPRVIVAQGYNVFIFKNMTELGKNTPLEKYHIGGLSIYNVMQRGETNTRYQLVLKNYDVQTPPPSALAVQNAFQNDGKALPQSLVSPTAGNTPENPFSPTAAAANNNNSEHKSPFNFPKSPTAAMISNNDVVFLTPEPLHPLQDRICPSFRRDSIQRPPKGFLVLSFEDDLRAHQQVYNFLTALKYQWLIEVTTAAATYLDRHQYWTVEGIFRLSASQVTLGELKENLYQGNAVNLKTYKDEHIFTNLIKVLIRELPDSPMSSGLYQSWLTAIQDYAAGTAANKEKDTKKDEENLQKLRSAIRTILKQMSYWQINFLSFLLPLIHHVGTFSAQSKMNYTNLSIVFAPNLLTAPLGPQPASFDNQKKINDLIAQIIERCYDLFLPVDDDKRSLNHVVLYDLHKPQYLNSLLEPLPAKNSEPKQTQIDSPLSPPMTPGNTAGGQPKSMFFSPAVVQPTPLHLGSNNIAATLCLDTPKINNIVSNIAGSRPFDPSGGFGLDPDADETTSMGSVYDGTKRVVLPDGILSPKNPNRRPVTSGSGTGDSGSVVGLSTNNSPGAGGNNAGDDFRPLSPTVIRHSNSSAHPKLGFLAIHEDGEHHAASFHGATPHAANGTLNISIQNGISNGSSQDQQLDDAFADLVSETKQEKEQKQRVFDAMADLSATRGVDANYIEAAKTGTHASLEKKNALALAQKLCALLQDTNTTQIPADTTETLNNLLKTLNAANGKKQ